MKFYKYLNENDEKMFEEIKGFVSRNCKPLIKEFKGKRINSLPYIGKKNVDNYDIKRTRKDRVPRDSSIEVHQFFDDLFHVKFKIRGRSQCIFVTGDPKEAKIYGPVNIVLPIGDYNLLGSTEIKDLWGMLDEDMDLMSYIDDDLDAVRDMIGSSIEDEFGEDDSMQDPDDLEPEFEIKMQEWDDEQGGKLHTMLKSYKTGNFIKALETHNEIMLECDRYILIDQKYEQHLRNWLDIR